MCEFMCGLCVARGRCMRTNRCGRFVVVVVVVVVAVVAVVVVVVVVVVV